MFHSSNHGINAAKRGFQSSVSCIFLLMGRTREAKSYWRCTQPCLNRNENTLHRNKQCSRLLRGFLLSFVFHDSLSCFHSICIDKIKRWSSRYQQANFYASPLFIANWADFALSPPPHSTALFDST